MIGYGYVGIGPRGKPSSWKGQGDAVDATKPADAEGAAANAVDEIAS